jgi:hypothetical protein
MSRRNWILLIVLVAQLGLVAWFYWPQPAPVAAGPLLADLAAAQVTGVTIEDNTARVALAQVDGAWVLHDGSSYPAAGLSVTGFISDVLAIDTGRLVATSPASHTRLRVSPADFVRRVTLSTVGGEQVVYIGASPNAGAVHVRAAESDDVYLADGALAGAARTDLTGWIDTTYLSLDLTSVQALTITNASGSLELVRDGAGAWNLADVAPGEDGRRRRGAGAGRSHRQHQPHCAAEHHGGAVLRHGYACCGRLRSGERRGGGAAHRHPHRGRARRGRRQLRGQIVRR